MPVMLSGTSPFPFTSVATHIPLPSLQPVKGRSIMYPCHRTLYSDTPPPKLRTFVDVEKCYYICFMNTEESEGGIQNNVLGSVLHTALTLPR